MSLISLLSIKKIPNFCRSFQTLFFIYEAVWVEQKNTSNKKEADWKMREYRLVDFFFLIILSIFYLFSNYNLDESLFFLSNLLWQGNLDTATPFVL